MPPDVEKFVTERIARAAREGFPFLTIADDRLRAEAEKFRATFGVDLPGPYVEVCRRCDGLNDENMARLHGLQTVRRPGREFPDYEGLLEIHERQMIDGTGREDFVEFGNRDGVEPWGWELTVGCFIRSDPNPLTGDALQRFDSFDEMFRALFRLTGQR